MPTGLEIPVLAPRPLPRVWGTAIASYPGLVGPEFDPDNVNVKRWLNGVTFCPFGCDKTVGQVFDPCVERVTTYTRYEPAEAIFYPFIAEFAVSYSSLNGTPEQWDQYILAHSENSRSSRLAEQVERGTYATLNPSLSSEAQVIANGDESLLGAVGAIEDALADVLDGAIGMIHVPASLLSILQVQGGLIRDDTGRFFTATGHVVVGDAGTLGVSPATGDPVAGEIWIYGSGPVFAKIDNLLRYTTPGEDNFNMPRNEYLLDAEQYMLALFEPCSVVAAKLNTADDNIVGESP
jgi:hypothetical protein